MIPESIQIPALVATVLALVSLIIIPVIAMTEWRYADPSSTALADAAEGTSCPLPPALDIEEGSEGSLRAGPLPIDEKEEKALKTATFALG